MVASFPDSILRFRGKLLESLLQQGFEVHVAAPGLSNHRLRREMEAKGLHTHPISLDRGSINPLSDLRTLLDLFLLMREIRPTYVLGYTVKPVIYGSLVAWFTRIPYRFALITGLGYAFQGGKQRRLVSRVVYWLYSASVRLNQKVFFQNPDDEELFRSLGILKAKTLSRVVNGSGVDLTEYEVTPLPASPRFLLIARLLGDKGVREYARAAQRVRQSHPTVEFDLVGWMDENPDTISADELSRWVASGHINFLGKLDDVRPSISSCNVYVLPSYREGTPRTVLEAMAMGRPIITTDAPGCRETVTDGENGFLVPVKAVDELVEAMVKFVQHPELISSMGQRSRRIAEQKYDVEKVNAIMLREMGIPS